MFIYLSTTKDEDSSDILTVFPGLLLAIGQIKLKTQKTGEILTERPTAEKKPFFGRWRKPHRPSTHLQHWCLQQLSDKVVGLSRETAAQRCVTFIWITFRRSTNQRSAPFHMCPTHGSLFRSNSFNSPLLLCDHLLKTPLCVLCLAFSSSPVSGFPIMPGYNSSFLSDSDFPV